LCHETSKKFGLFFSGTTYAEETCMVLPAFPSPGDHDVSAWRSTQPKFKTYVHKSIHPRRDSFGPSASQESFDMLLAQPFSTKKTPGLFLE
jgi:hypothetical protein